LYHSDKRAVYLFVLLVERDTMMSFAACGFAAEPVTAVWLPS
jgi:hypothetical protein